MSDTLLDRLVARLDDAGRYEENVMVGPVAVLWPDEERQWESAVSALQERRRVVRHGPLDAALRQGPAYWLRCVIESTVDIDGAPDGRPIVYLPGVSRDTLRGLDHLPPELAPLAALQHRCQWFSHPNGKDWSVRALLAHKDKGIGLDVASDATTATLLAGTIGHLLDQAMTRLESRTIDTQFLNITLNPDPARMLLNWLDDPTGTRSGMTDQEWAAFVAQCRHEFDYDPAADGPIAGARRLGEAAGPWAIVWQRFRDAPTEYPDIPNLLDNARPDELLPANPGAWPEVSSDGEESLRIGLTALDGSSASEARGRLLHFEDEHKARRGYVWADLGRAPLALALEHLAVLAEATASGPVGSSVDAIVHWYSSTGWRADRAVLMALNEVDRKVDLAAVSAAITAVYRPWLDTTAGALQAAVGPMANADTYPFSPPPTPSSGTVVVFIDGLRLDVAHLLADRLAGAGLDPALDTALAALPTVTQTSKPTLVPIDQALLAAGQGLDARRAPDGPAAGVAVLRPLMAAAGVQVLGPSETGDPTGVAWTETGTIDHRGHDLGVRIAHEIDDEVERIAVRIQDLVDAGWQLVSVVTDHGWILLPGGLPKCEDLPVAATDTKKGRCARVKDGAAVSVPTVPWHWDHDVRIAVAPGVSCFEANQAYEHGGVSPQECVVPHLTVRRGAAAAVGTAITNLKWRGLTLVVEFTDLPDGARFDLRSRPGDAGSSIAEVGQGTQGSGKVLLLVADDDLEGDRAHLVVVADDGSLLLQRETTVGQNR